jgi:acyl carrier protein
MPSSRPQTWTSWQTCNTSFGQYNHTPLQEHVNSIYPQHITKGSKAVAVTQEEIIAGIAEIIEEVTGIEPSEVTPEKSFVDDLDIDSLSMVEIAVQTEDKYGVKIPDEDLAGLRTVGDVVAYIQKLEEENPEAAQALRAKIESENPEAVEKVQARLEADSK